MSEAVPGAKGLADGEGTTSHGGRWPQQRGKAGKRLLPRGLREGPAPWGRPGETDFGRLTSGTAREKAQVVLGHRGCGYLLQQQQETDTVFWIFMRGAP